MIINATIITLEKKTFNNGTKEITFNNAKVLFEGADYPCYISVKLDDDISTYKLNKSYKLDLLIGAYNFKPIYKYTILKEV